VAEADRPPPGHAFISYVREDSARVDRLQRTLEAAGIRVWRDTADLWPGEDWRMKIRHAITDNALVFIACFSLNSLAREKSYQNEELALAIDQLRLRRPDVPWLIPVRFDDCHIPDYNIGGGRTLASIQRAELFGDRYKREASRLVTTALRLLGPSFGAPSAVAGARGARSGMQAVERLSNRRGLGTTEALLSRLRDHDGHVRRTAVEALADRDGPTVTDALLDHLRDEDAHVRRAVVQALADREGPTITEALMVSLYDPHSAVRQAAVEALAQRESDGEVNAGEIASTPKIRLLLRRANVDDLWAVTDLLQDASRWLGTKETDQWARPWPDEEGRRERILAAIRAGRTWVIWDDALPTATITTSPNDHQVWPEEYRGDLAVYIRRLVVSRRYAGQDLGLHLLDWAGYRARREYGAHWVRVDLWTTNSELHAYFRGLGFVFCGLSEIPDYPSAALFQKSTEQISLPQGPQFIEAPDHT
jgi:hypothetical protein